MSANTNPYANAGGQAWNYNTDQQEGWPEATWPDNGSSSSWQDAGQTSANEQAQAAYSAHRSYPGQRASPPIALPNFGNSSGSGHHIGFHPPNSVSFSQSEGAQSAYSYGSNAPRYHHFNSMNGTPNIHIHNGHPVPHDQTSFSHEASHLGEHFDTKPNNVFVQHDHTHYEEEDYMMEGSMASDATATPANLQDAFGTWGQQFAGLGDPNAGPPAQHQQFASSFPTGHQHMQFLNQFTESNLQQYNEADAEGHVPVSWDPDPCVGSSAAAGARELLASGYADDHGSDGASSDGSSAASDKQSGKKAKAKAPICACATIKKDKKSAIKGKCAEDCSPPFEQPPSKYSEVLFVKQHGTSSYLCSDCGKPAKSDKAKARHISIQHWNKAQRVCFMCSGYYEYDPPRPLPPNNAPIDFTEATGPPWRCRLCNDDDPGSFQHTWEKLEHLWRVHFYALRSPNMYMIRRGEEAASAHFGEFTDPGHVLIHAWLKKKRCGHLITVVDDAYDILYFCDISGSQIHGLAQLGKCRAQREHDRSTMIPSLRAGYTKAVLQYVRLPQIWEYFKWAVQNRWGPGFEHALCWPWSGEEASRLMRALAMLSFHNDECVSRQLPPGRCDGCSHSDAIQPQELAMLAVRLAQIDQRPAARLMPEEVMPAPKRRGPGNKGKQPLL